MRSGARSCATPGVASSRSSTGPTSWPSCGRGPPRPSEAGWTPRSRRLKLDLGVTAAEVAADPGAGPIARAFVTYEDDAAPSAAPSTSTTWSATLSSLSRHDTALLDRWRGRCGAPAGRRGPGRRPLAASARTPARGSPRTASSSSATTTSRSMAGVSRTCGASWPSARRYRDFDASISRSTIAARRPWSTGPSG